MYVGEGRTRHRTIRAGVASLGLTVLAGLLGCNSKQGDASQPFADASPAPPKPTASAAPAPVPSFPGAPALLPGERPPPRSINYFEPHEMTAGGMAAAYDSCVKAGGKTDPPIETEKVVQYCSCIVDAWRQNTHDASNPLDPPNPSKEQMARCGQSVREGDGGSPFGFPFPKNTGELYKAWQGCIGKFYNIDHGVFCGCYVDATFKDPVRLGITPANQARCELADQYWDHMKVHMTQRQFDGLVEPSGDGGTEAGAVDCGRDAAPGKGR
jgi:hypothetical protein